MFSILYEVQPVQNGCILKLKESNQNIENESKISEGTKKGPLKGISILEVKRKKPKSVSSLIKKKNKEILNKSANKKIEKRHKSIDEFRYKEDEKSTHKDNRELLRTNRQQFWDILLSAGKWLDVGKNFKASLEYEKLLGPDGNGKSNSLSKNFPNSRQLGNMFPDGQDMNNVKESRSLQNLSLKMKVMRGGTGKRHSNYFSYLYIDEIIPGVLRPAPGILAGDIDLQALKLTIDELTDENIPFNVKSFSQFLQTSIQCSWLNEDAINSLSIEGLGDILDLKKNMTRDDWECIAELYAEFRSKGIIEVYRVVEQILIMAAKSHTKMNEWYMLVGMSKRLTALKIGALFLNIFHVCYLESAQDTDGIDEMVISNNVVSNDEIIADLSEDILEKLLYRKNDTELKRKRSIAKKILNKKKTREIITKGNINQKAVLPTKNSKERRKI